MHRILAPIALALLISTTASANCYRLYDAERNEIYIGETAPFSMAWPDEAPERVASRARGEHLIFTRGDPCQTRSTTISPTAVAALPPRSSLYTTHAASAPHSYRSPRTSSPRASSGGGQVYVKAHYRQGRYVQAHTRQAPRRR